MSSQPTLPRVDQKKSQPLSIPDHKTKGNFRVSLLSDPPGLIEVLHFEATCARRLIDSGETTQRG
jgi:hypothetical protein